ncbi:hypothetical protein G6F68_017566 [Rhizopus microsporus]|nr:hypothetical protein G6F68_017566 [Rhizopus microsporus]
MTDPTPAPAATSDSAVPQAQRAMSQRFRGFLPVVVDVETGGFDSQRNALLEIAAVPIEMDENGLLYPGQTASAHVVPAEGLEIDPKKRKRHWPPASSRCVPR